MSSTWYVTAVRYARGHYYETYKLGPFRSRTLALFTAWIERIDGAGGWSQTTHITEGEPMTELAYENTGLNAILYALREKVRRGEVITIHTPLVDRLVERLVRWPEQARVLIDDDSQRIFVAGYDKNGTPRAWEISGHDGRVLSDQAIDDVASFEFPHRDSSWGRAALLLSVASTVFIIGCSIMAWLRSGGFAG